MAEKALLMHIDIIMGAGQAEARARRPAQRPFELAFFDTGPGVRVLRFDWPNKCYKLPRGGQY